MLVTLTHSPTFTQRSPRTNRNKGKERVRETSYLDDIRAADKFLHTEHLIKGSLCLCVLFPGPTAHQTLRIWLRQDSASDILARVYIGVRPGQPRGKGTKDRAGDCQRCTLWCVCEWCGRMELGSETQGRARCVSFLLHTIDVR